MFVLDRLIIPPGPKPRARGAHAKLRARCGVRGAGDGDEVDINVSPRAMSCQGRFVARDFTDTPLADARILDCFPYEADEATCELRVARVVPLLSSDDTADPESRVHDAAAAVSFGRDGAEAA